MRRAWVALAVAGIIAFTATPASACTIALEPLAISPKAGGAGTSIYASGYCQGDLTVTLGWPADSGAARPPVDRVTVTGNGGQFQVTLTNRYAPPLPPERPYLFDMEVASVCAGQPVGRVPFFATEHSTAALTHVVTVGAGGRANVRGFDGAGNADTALNDFVRTEGSGGSVALGKPPPNANRDALVFGTGPGTEASFSLVGRYGGATAYPGFRGGVNVAVGDVDGDGDDDFVTGPGPGGGPDVKVWKIVPGDPGVAACGPSIAASAGWYAYDPAFAGGVSVAAADLDGDGKAEIITGALAGGGPHVRVWNEVGHLESEFMAYDPKFLGGVNVAAANVIGDGRADIVTGAGPGGGPHVRVFDRMGGALSGFYAYAPEWTGGVFVAAGHPSPATYASIVTGPGAGGGPHVRVLTAQGGATGGFYAYDPGFGAGVRVAVAP